MLCFVKTKVSHLSRPGGTRSLTMPLLEFFLQAIRKKCAREWPSLQKRKIFLTTRSLPESNVSIMTKRVGHQRLLLNSVVFWHPSIDHYNVSAVFDHFTFSVDEMLNSFKSKQGDMSARFVE